MQTKYRAMSLRTRLGSVLARKSLGSSTHNRRIIHTIRRDTINIASSTRSLAPEGWKASNDVTSSTRSHHSHYHLYCHRHRHISNANDDNNGQKNKDSCDTDGDESNGIYFQLNHNHRNAQNFNNRTFTRHFNFPTPLSHSPLPKTAKTELTGAKSSFRAFISSSASASASATEQTSSPPHNNPISDTEKEEIITHFAMGTLNACSDCVLCTVSVCREGL